MELGNRNKNTIINLLNNQFYVITLGVTRMFSLYTLFYKFKKNFFSNITLSVVNLEGFFANELWAFVTEVWCFFILIFFSLIFLIATFYLPLLLSLFNRNFFAFNLNNSLDWQRANTSEFSLWEIFFTSDNSCADS